MFGYYVHDLDPIILRLWDNVGPRWYGFAYVMAFVCGFVVVRWLSQRGYCQLPPERVGDFITWSALFGVMLGGRLGYVLFYRPEMLRDPLSIFKVWEGGMSSHGGMIGLFLYTLFYSRRHGYSWVNIGDNLVVAAPIGLFFGRCANFINGELYGRITNVAWAMQFPKELLDPDNAAEADHAVEVCRRLDPAINSPETLIASLHTHPAVKNALRTILTPRHPSQLYEAFFEGIVLFVILWIVRTCVRTSTGVLTGLFFLFYAIFRIVVENFREPDASLIGGYTRGQFFSFFLVVIAFGFFVFAYVQSRKRAQPV